MKENKSLNLDRAYPYNSLEFRNGIALLLQAFAYSQDAETDIWDFALEIDKLYESGLTICDLRWLVSKQYVEHGRESSVYGDTNRLFQANNGLIFVPATCFVITPTGANFAGRLLEEPLAD